jgi:hypothetical protein
VTDTLGTPAYLRLPSGLTTFEFDFPIHDYCRYFFSELLPVSSGRQSTRALQPADHVGKRHLSSLPQTMFRAVSSKLTVAAMGARFASSSGTSGKHDDKQQQGKQGDQAKGNSSPIHISQPNGSWHIPFLRLVRFCFRSNVACVASIE